MDGNTDETIELLNGSIDNIKRDNDGDYSFDGVIVIVHRSDGRIFKSSIGLDSLEAIGLMEIVKGRLVNGPCPFASKEDDTSPDSLTQPPIGT